MHSSTGYTPSELFANRDNHLNIHPALIPRKEEEEDWEEKITKARETLEKQAQKRANQAAKHQTAEIYQPGDRVWVKLHRRSDASRRLTKKIHLVYNGPYMIIQELRRNAYLIGDLQGQPRGAYNIRQLRPDRQAKLKPEDQSEDSDPEEDPQDENEEYDSEPELPEQSSESKELEPRQPPRRRRRRWRRIISHDSTDDSREEVDPEENKPDENREETDSETLSVNAYDASEE